MIGDLLRFAPGHLGARQDRAPDRCEFRWWVVSSLPCVTPETSWNPSSARSGARRAVWPEWQPAARRAHASAVTGSRGGGGAEGGLGRAGVKDDGGRGRRAARLRLWPCPSPSRIFDRCAAPSASLTASLRHGIGRRGGRQ